MNVRIKENGLLYLIIVCVAMAIWMGASSVQVNSLLPSQTSESSWIGPSLYLDHTLKGERRKLVMYGEELIAHTARYLGPQGTMMQITNGMNCQNCHLQAGKQVWGNNYSAVFSTYPKFRDRSGGIETIAKRVNDCIERSLNGTPLDTTSKEMSAILAYMEWLSDGVPKGEKPVGSGIRQLAYLNRAADPQRGAVVYTTHCASCHGVNGQGEAAKEGRGYRYPPLWGSHSYNTGAGLYRLSRLAGFVKDNMPFEKSSHQSPLLSDEEAWDVAAFVNSRPRPVMDISRDWPDMSKKPIDHPFGPYADQFSEQQHKYGPFQPIIQARQQP